MLYGNFYYLVFTRPSAGKIWSSICMQDSVKSILHYQINPFYATGFFRYPLKTTENQRFSDVFRGYRKRPVA